MATVQAPRRRPVVRVGFALGSWQLLAMAAAMNEAAEARAHAAAGAGGDAAPVCEDHLVLYETVAVSEALRAAMHEVGEAVRPWRSVVDAFDFFAAVQRKIDQPAFDALKDALRRQIGLERIDELWLCWLTRPPEKLILETYPEATVHLYEDGLMSYLPLRATPDEPPPGERALFAPWRARLRERLDAWRPVRRFRRYKSALDPHHARRLAGSWMLLGDLWPQPAALAQVPMHRVSRSALRAVLARCAVIAGVAAVEADLAAAGERDVSAAATAARASSASPPRRTVLMLGQTLSRWQVLSRDAELQIYRDAVALVVERGYDVCWKEHPRALQPFFAELAASAPPGRVRELALPFALPVELVAERLGLAACVAGISAALFYLPRLYGIAAFSFADALAPHLREGWALQNELVRRAASPLADLPVQPMATEPVGA